jgi:putative MATE family efflux protein
MADVKATIELKPSGAKDWTRGPILRNILLLSWPMATMETLYVISQVFDLVWVGRLGSTAVAGIGIAFVIVMLVTSLDFGMVVGARAMVARYVGANDIKTANHIAAQALVLVCAWGLVMTALGLTLAGPVMRLMGLEPGVIAEGVAYMRVTFAGWITMDVMIVVLYIVQSSGDTIRPLILEALTRVIHIALCPFLVLGIGIFPRLGVGGAALASVIGQTVGAGLALWLFFGGATRLRVARHDFRLDLKIIGRILRIGLPALLTNLQRSFGMFVITWLVVPFGTLAVAATSIVSRVEMFVTLPGLGLGMGAGVLAGQNLGAGRPERAEKSGWLAAGVLQATMVAVSGLILVLANGIAGLFTDDPELIRLGSSCLRIASAAFLAMSYTSVLQSCIAGAGDTVPNMITGFIVNWVVQLPLALLLPRFTNLGVLGIRWAVVAGVTVGTVIYISYFRLGRWKLKKV